MTARNSKNAKKLINNLPKLTVCTVIEVRKTALKIVEPGDGQVTIFQHYPISATHGLLNRCLCFYALP
jgi:hypothetical protein